MAALTDAQALEAWKEALDAARHSKSYQIGPRTLTRHDITDIMRMIEWYERRIARASRSGRGGFGLADFGGAI
jgi:hypothetical protein